MSIKGYLFHIVAWGVFVLLIPLFVRPLKLRPMPCAVLLIGLFAVLQRFAVFSWLTGNPYNPDLPAWFVNLYSFCYTGVLLLFVAVVCVWLFRMGARLVTRQKTLRPLPNKALVGTAAGLSAWSLWEGVRIPDVKRYEIRLGGFPRAFDGLRIVQLSDLHANPVTTAGKFRQIVDRANALKPDLICITGDFVDGSVARLRDQLVPLADLKAPLGVLCCAGNHDFYFHYRAWKPAFEDLGLKMLDNEHHLIRRGGAALAVGGVVDEAGVTNMARRGEKWWPAPDVERAFRDAPQGAYRILLRHRPLDLAAAARAGVGLQLSGHTHGGIVLGFDQIVGMVNDGHVRGFYDDRGVKLFVHSGTCQWGGFPIRMGVPGEIAELTLRCGPHAV